MDMATNTSFLSLSKPAYSENVSLSAINSNMDKIDAAVGQRSRVVNLLDNSCFLPLYVVNQRGAGAVTGNKYGIDRWKGATSASLNEITADGIMITHTGTSGYCGIIQALPDKLTAAIKDKTVTVAVCLADGTVYARSGIPANGSVSASFSNGMAQTYNNTDTGVMYLRIMHSNAGGSVTVRWVALYEGAYTAETLPAYQPKGYAAELLACQQYFHLYGTSAARPSHGKDCTPHMIADAPTQGTVSINGVTHYYNSADL